MTWIDDRIADVEREIAGHREAARQLKSGELTMHEGVGRHPMQDVSAEVAKMHDDSVGQLEKLVAAYKVARRGGDGEH